MNLNVVILAAGKGTRMRSKLPKVLHPLAGTPMVERVCHTASALSAEKIIVVYGHGGDKVPATLSHLPVTWVEQAQQLGTGHAVTEALPQVQEDSVVLVLYGDVPLIREDTLAKLLTPLETQQGVALLTAKVENPTGYGRIVRNHDHKVVRIVEHKDATEAELAINEVNTGILAAYQSDLSRWLAQLDNDNIQGEYYLTDIVAMAVKDSREIFVAHPGDFWETAGVNDRRQLAELERIHQLQVAESLMLAGVSLADPARIDVRGELICGQDCHIDVDVVFEGRVRLGDNVKIGPFCVLNNVEIDDNAEILSHCNLEQSAFGKGCMIGPYARTRPGTVLAEKAKLGNFVETKNARIGHASKVNHLSYVGDTDMGQRVNVGAGTITCNYDGANKHKTLIGDDVFIGSDTQLVAPVEVGAGATIGAGSTITQDAPSAELTLSRVRQKSIKGWKRPVKNSK